MLMRADESRTDPGLTAAETAERLGVEVATIYAYASRGALRKRTGPDGRRSFYDPDEVELLLQKARPRSVRRRPGAVDVVIGTTISEIGDGWIHYRGHDVLGLVERYQFEEVAHLLWTGQLTEDHPRPGSIAEAREIRDHVETCAEQTAATIDPDAPIMRLAAGVAAAATALQPSSVADPSQGGALLIDAMIAALPLVGDPVDPSASVARRLWVRCSPLLPTPARVRVLDQALILLAEHELATSTLAVRVAASTHAGPAQVLLAGLGAVSGELHGGAASRVHQRLLRSPATGAGISDDGATTHADGFGHPVHRSGDPRYAQLHLALHSIASTKAHTIIDADLAAHAAAGLPPPNIDAALGALGYVIRGEPGITDAIFAIARTAGWLAHAFEEIEDPPLRYRGRTVYRGS